MMMLNLARQTPRLIKDGFPLDYDKDFVRYRGIELKGKTAGIIGLGNIGTSIAERCAGLGMNVVAWTRSPKEGKHKAVSIEELFATADVIFPALAKNEETLSLVSDQTLGSMKPSAIVVDIVHGLLNHELLLTMVKENRLFGYGFESEPGEFASFEANVWAAPAYAWATESSMRNGVAKTVENILNASKGNFPNRINV